MWKWRPSGWDWAKNKVMRIAFIYNRCYGRVTRKRDEEAEFEPLQTIKLISQALRDKNHTVYLLEASLDVFEKIKKLKPKIDLVFNLAEGFRGEARESLIPIFLEQLEIPYTGSGPTTLAVTLDKALTKEILLLHHLPTPPFQLFRTGRERLNRNLSFPLIVKPNIEGSSKGIYNDSIVRSLPTLHKKTREIIKKYNQPALVEKFLPGREFFVAIWGNGKETEVLPLGEVRFHELGPLGKHVASFEVKHFGPPDEVSAKTRPRLSRVLERKIKKICLKAYQVLNCWDFVRMDVRLDKNNRPFLLEVNALPSIGPATEDGFTESAEMAGYSYKEMVNHIVKIAAKRLGLNVKK